VGCNAARNRGIFTDGTKTKTGRGTPVVLLQRLSLLPGAELIAGGGKIQVPCLRVENKDGDVRWIYETSEIIRYLKTELVV